MAQSPSTQRWPGTTALVPLELTNNPQVTLDYEVKKKGPSGVRSVELYLTDDDGRTWRPYVKNDNPALASTISATLPGEGVFGLRLVFTSGAGVKRKPPQPGDLAQMRIEVDTTPPVVKFLTPTSDPSRRDILVLNWTANDKNLASNPITLEWAEKSDGPWNMIASELPNAGRYNWHVSSTLPCQVYLRITARDSAGNVGTDEFSDPVLIDNYEPEGQLIGLAKSRPQTVSMGSR
jgi:hypothetical protein